ncbi:MAG: type II secretion system protein [Planctomycetota bacterium]|nr:type II secretion system protein [Planctomycetota bacterium]
MMNLNPTTSHSKRRGMTLVEILVVITIIAMLAGMLIPVIGAVRRRGEVTATVLEIQNLKAALETYKQKVGDYPPDGSNSVVFQRHVRIAFPRIAPQEMNNLLSLIIEPHEPEITYLDPAESLVFFLGGFSDDPRFPFTGKGGPLANNRNPGIFDFDPQRLGTNDDNDPFPVYYPRGSEIPFVYFDSRTYMPRAIYTYNGAGVPAAAYPLEHNHGASPVKGVARPYRSDQPRQATADDGYGYKWVNPNTFQIIAAGVTDDYGLDLDPVPLDGIPTNKTPYKHYPSGANYSDGDNSNITSFSQGTLEDDIP